MSNKSELVKNTLILGVGRIFTQLISFLFLPLYTAFLAPEDYGTVDLVTTYTALLMPIIIARLDLGCFRFLIDARSDEAEKKRIISNTLQLTLLGVACFALLYLAVLPFIHIPYAGLILSVFCFTAISGIAMQIARGVGDNIGFTIASIITGLTGSIATIVFVVGFRWTAAGLLWAILLSNIAGILYILLKLKLHMYVSFRERDVKLQKELIRYSLPLVPSGISWWAINAADRTIISVFLGVAANGIYAVSNKFAIIFTSIYSIFSMSWVESASVHINSKNSAEFFSEVGNASVRLFGAMGAGLIATIPLIFGVAIDNQYKEAYLYIPILILAAFFNAVIDIYNAIYIAKKKTAQTVKANIISAIISILLNLALIKLIGLWAAPLSMLVMYIGMAIYRHHDTREYITIRYEKGLFAKMIALYTIAIALYYYNWLPLNIVSLVVVTVAAITLNRSIIKVAKAKVFSKLRKLSPQQEVEEEVEFKS